MIEVILLFVLLFFAKSITYGYVSDDVPVSRLPKSQNKFKHAWQVFLGYEKSTPQIDHFITLIMHALVCVGIYLAFGSFWAAMLFAVNPINNQGSVWISGRPYVLPTLVLLWSMVFPIASPALLLLGSNYTLGVVMPIILVFYQPLIGALLPILWLLKARRFKSDVVNKINTQSFAEDKKIKPEKLIIATKTFGFYLIHALIPIKTTFYHSFLQSAAGCGKEKAYKIDRFFWIGLAGIAGIVFYWTSFSWNIVSFALLWWCIGIAPFLNFIRVQQEIAERYAYLPTVGLMVALASVLPQHLLWLLIGIYASKLWFYMDSYQNDFYLNENACLNSPDSWFAWHVRGHIRWNAQSYHEALIMWTMAKNISPREFKVLFNIAVCCMANKHKQEALYFLEQAQANIPEGQEESSMKMIEEFKNGTHYPILL